MANHHLVSVLVLRGGRMRTHQDAGCDRGAEDGDDHGRCEQTCESPSARPRRDVERRGRWPVPNWRCAETGRQLWIDKCELWTDRLEAVQSLPFVHVFTPIKISLADCTGARRFLHKQFALLAVDFFGHGPKRRGRPFVARLPRAAKHAVTPSGLLDRRGWMHLEV
jgi:hypothetical protein